MNVRALYLEPVDGWSFRDGRPFEAGEAFDAATLYHSWRAEFRSALFIEPAVAGALSGRRLLCILSGAARSGPIEG
ncbi:MAG: hypothetical protein MUF51_11935 [Vicinamibacteria bacterium]|nr:hypothetical protein [Vicinamibacteria bacterium]